MSLGDINQAIMGEIILSIRILMGIMASAITGQALAEIKGNEVCD